MPQTVIHLFQAADGSVPLQDWLDELEAREPRAYRKCLQRILLLSQLGNELRRPLSDTLRDGIRELRVREGRVHYRILYFFHGSHVAYLSHGITKQGAVPDAEIERALERMKLVEGDADAHTAEQEGE